MMNYNDGQKHFRMNDFTKVRLVLVCLWHLHTTHYKMEHFNTIGRSSEVDMGIFWGLHWNGIYISRVLKTRSFDRNLFYPNFPLAKQVLFNVANNLLFLELNMPWNFPQYASSFM